MGNLGQEVTTCLKGSDRRLPRRAIVIAGAYALILAGACSDRVPAGDPVIIEGTAVPPLPALDPQEVARGERIYEEYCAQCHGADLQGAANWKTQNTDGSFPPPPHDSSGHTWHHPDDVLLDIIADGGDPAYNSKMPAFRDRLSDQDRRAALEFIKSRWGQEEREFQWWVTAREPSGQFELIIPTSTP